MANNILFNLLRTLSKNIFPLITFMYAARVLGEDGIGKFSFSKSIITWFTLLAMLGMDNYGVREAAKRRDDRRELSRFSQEMLLINLVSTLFSYALLIVALCLIPKFHDYQTLLLINSVAIFMQGMGMEWLYQALEKYRYLALRSFAFQGIALVAMFVFVRTADDVIPYMIVYLVATSGPFLLNFWNARRWISFRRLDAYQFRKHLRPLLWLFAMVLSAEMYTVLDTAMLGFLQNDAAVGRYTAAVKITRVVNTVIFSLSMALIPRLSYYVGRGEKEKVKEVVNKAYNYVFMLSVPAAVGLFVLSKEILRLFSGSGFLSANLTMQILTITVIVIPFSVSTNQQTLIPLGEEKRSVAATVVGAITNFICNMVFIPRLAECGAAIGTVVAEVCVAMVSFYNASRFFNMKRIFRVYFQYWLAALPIPLIAWLAGHVFEYDFMYVTLVILASIPAYFGVLYLLKNEFLLVALRQASQKGTSLFARKKKP